MIKGIITRGVGGLYGVRLNCKNGNNTEENNEVLCRARGKFRNEGLTLLVGDIVEYELDGDSENGGNDEGVRVDYVINDVYDRKNELIRPPMANLTHLFAVVPAARPAPDLLTVDKLTIIAENYGIEPVIVVNKSDIDPAMADRIEKTYNIAGYEVFKLSAETGEGTDKLMDYIAKTAENSENNGESMMAAFAGVSGAGKSTLMKKIFPHLDLKAGDISVKTARGKHTTRHVELYPVKAGNAEFYIADTPGFSMLDFTRFNFFTRDELAFSFREFAECVGMCRYTKCTHTKEEGCVIIEKMKDGMISESRHDSYCRILDEMKKKPDWKRAKEMAENIGVGGRGNGKR